MRRVVAASVALAALVLGACEGSSDSGYVSYGGYSDGCRQFTSCGTCTPVNGCGWCFDSDGTGICASGPDECVTPVFSWTWNPSGCRVPASAGTTPVDAGAATPPQDDAALPGEDAMSIEADGESEASIAVDAESTSADGAFLDGTADLLADPHK